MADSHRDPRRSTDPLLGWLIGLAIGLVVLNGALLLFWGPGPVIAVLTWYVPAMHSFFTLAALAIALLAFGRYQVLCQPTPFWIGMAFSIFAVLTLFYILSWPGLLPDERGLIAVLPGTSAWLYDLSLGALAIFLLVAVFAPWPGSGTSPQRWWLWLVVVGLSLAALTGSLSVGFERSLPVLVVDGGFTPLQIAFLVFLIIALAVGAVLMAGRYRQTGDSLIAWVALTQLALTFAVLSSIIGGRRYDLWWYWQRILVIGAFSVMLVGLLSEYVGLYRRERQKTLESETLRRQQEEFVHILAHDIRQPLTIIQGQSQMLNRLLDVNRVEPAKKSAEAITSSARRMNVMIQDLVDSMRMETRRLDLNLRPIDIEPYLKDLLRRSSVSYDVSRVRLDVDRGVPPVLADPDRLERIVLNLLSNALKYSDPGTPVDLRVSQQDGQAIVSFQDYGRGIAPEDVPHIFERFYKTRGPRKKESIGLGLFITRLIVEAHHGRIWVESAPSKGSKFHFSLPLA